MTTKHLTLYLIGLMFTCLAVLGAPIQDISFSDPNWEFTNGATYNSSTEELTITGNPNTYEYARLTISLPSNTSDIYLAADLYLENIVLGNVPWYAPKLKVLPTTGGSIKAMNLDSPAQGSWYNTFMQTNVNSYNEVIIEFGFQNSSGTFTIKNPTLTDTEPVPTPYSFPYGIPSNPSCRLNLSSSDLIDFNNDLLSTNSHFSWASKSWGDSEVSETINEHFPMSNLRFPGGTVGNFYNWTTDGYYNDPSTFANNSRQSLYNSNFKFDYLGFKDQVISSSASATLMFNVIHDDITSAANRLQSRVNDGLNIKWVELGNENFYGTQSYGYISGGQWQVSDIDEYISHTKALVNSLKVISPNTGYAVCMNHHDYTSGSWSDVLSQETYFDAAVMHNYNNVGNENLDYGSGVVLLDSYKYTRKNIQTYQQYFGSTPMLVSEWGVLGSKSFLGVLSSADMFLALLEGNTYDGVVQQAGIHMLYHSDSNAPQSMILLENGQIKYTPNGVFYAKLFEVFKDKQIYTALSASEEVTTGLPGVISRGVDYGDSIKVFSVNKLPVSSDLIINLDGELLSESYRTETYSMNPDTWPNAYNNPNEAWTNNENSGAISLPAYSISVVTIKKPSETATAASNLTVSKLTAYPNPVSDKLYLDGVQNNTPYTLFDTHGNMIISGRYTSNGILTEKLSSGIYFIQAGQLTTKFIVQ